MKKITTEVAKAIAAIAAIRNLLLGDRKDALSDFMRFPNFSLSVLFSNIRNLSMKRFDPVWTTR